MQKHDGKGWNEVVRCCPCKNRRGKEIKKENDTRGRLVERVRVEGLIRDGGEKSERMEWMIETD